MKGGYCLLVSEKQTIDLHLFQLTMMAVPMIQEWLMTASSPLPSTVPESSGPGLSCCLYFPRHCCCCDFALRLSPLNHSLLSSHQVQARALHVIDNFQEIFKHNLVLMVWGRKKGKIHSLPGRDGKPQLKASYDDDLKVWCWVQSTTASSGPPGRSQITTNRRTQCNLVPCG